MRHLYAHNFAGLAAAKYFERTRHVLHQGVPVTLSSGAEFDGTNLSLRVADLRHFADCSTGIAQAALMK